MKYLKLYEAFKSKGISNTLKFLNEKIGKKESNRFLKVLKDFMKNSDFPIDKISDDDIEYMRAQKAISLRTKNLVSNPKGIELIKFWFSLEKGFLGYTGTGNKEFKFVEKTSGKKEQEKFSDSELQYITSQKGIKGEIWPVSDYNKLKTGDLVMGYFDYDKSWRKFDVGYVYVDSENRYYVCQDVSEGSYPNDNGWNRFNKRYSWFIYSESESVGPDHRCLHMYKETDEDLHYIEVEDEDKKENQEENPLIWNLPFGDLELTTWGNWSQESINSHNEIDKADFAIVLYYDKMTNPDVDAPYFEPVSSKKIERKKEKVGAVALMSDDTIKKENLERYISKLSGDLEISKEELSNLGKIIIKCILGEFSFISIYQNRKSNLDRLQHICSYLYSMISDPDSEIYYINDIKNTYKNLNETYYRDLTYFMEIKSLIKRTEAEKIFNKIYELGSLISELIKKQNAQSIDDVLILYQKLQSIRNFMYLDQNKLTYVVRNIFSEFFNKSSVEYYLKEFNDSYSDRNYQEDVKKLERVEKYIRSVL